MDTDIRRLLETEEMEAERRTNSVRLLVLTLFLFVFAGFYMMSGRHYTAGYVVMADLLVTMVYAVILRGIMSRGRYHTSFKYLSAAADTICITVLAMASLFLSSGLTLQGWIANIAVFLLFIALSGLRFSPGLCLFTGMITTGELVLLNLLVSFAGGQPLPLAQLATIAILLLAASGVVTLTARTARLLIIRASMAERQRTQLASEADQARLLAITDELTGLFNRRFFMAELKREVARSGRYGRTFAVLIVDVDRFKQVNDTLGHLAGDLFLRQMASAIRRKSRETDVVARLGGDEFGLIVCEASAEQAQMAAERLCQAVREHEFEVDADHHDFVASLSIGVACFPADAADMEGLLRAADRAVYHAKALGRDRVAWAPP